MRSRPTRVLALALTVLLVCPVPGRSWGNEGHRLVSDIVEAALTNDSTVLQRLHAVFGPTMHLRDIATCPDRIRDFVRDTKKGLDHACAPFIATFATPQDLPTLLPHSDKWHFINIPLNNHPPTHSDVLLFCGMDGCAPGQIKHFHDTLLPTASVPVQAEAILFLTHLVGDLHQPLHSAVRNNDAGGNAVFVTIFGQSFTLHHVWDDEIITRMKDEHGNTITTETARSQHLSAQLPSPGPFDPEQWGLDAFQLAKAKAYVNHGAGTSPGAPAPSLPDVRTAPGATLHDAEYLAVADPVVQQQLRLAGVRLAGILRDQLSTPPHAPPGPKKTAPVTPKK